MGKNSLTPWRNNNLNIRLVRHQVVYLKTVCQLASNKYFFAISSIFQYNKTLITRPAGNGEFCISSTLNVEGRLGKQNSLFPRSQSLTAYLRQQIWPMLRWLFVSRDKLVPRWQFIAQQLVLLLQPLLGRKTTWPCSHPIGWNMTSTARSLY